MTFQISNSQMNTFLDCPAKWSYIYRHKKRSSDTAPLRKGSYIHHLLDLIYTWIKMQEGQRIPDSGFPQDILEGICLPASNEDDLQLKAEAATLVMMYVRYVADMDYNWQILAVEESFYNNLLTPKGRQYILEMHVDLIFRNMLSNQFVVADHKSGQIWKQEEAECDPQMGLYIAPLHKVGYPISYGLYNFLNTRILRSGNQNWKDNFARRPVVKSKAESDATLHNFGARVDEIIDRTADDGVQFPMVRKKSCTYCSFNDVCKLRIKGEGRAAREVLAGKEDRPTSGNRRNEEKAEFIALVEGRKSNNLSPYELTESTIPTLTIRKT